MSGVFDRCLRTAAVVLVPLAFAPSHAMAGHSWANYHWARTSNPVLLPLGDNVSGAWQPYLGTASSEWNKSRVLATSMVPGKARPKTCKPTAGRVEVCSERYGFNGWLGVAQIWISGGHITQGSTKVNDSYFNTAKYNTPGWRNMVMCQEIGHTFGLDHQDENFSNPNLGTCMDYTSNPDAQPRNWYPDAHDFAQLEQIYTHLDSGSAVAQATETGRVPPASAVSDEELQVGTAQWGRLIRSTNRGRTETFELDLGAGRKVFTFVIWADPEDQPGSAPGRSPR